MDTREVRPAGAYRDDLPLLPERAEMIPAAKLPSLSPREEIAPPAIALPVALRRWSVRAALLITGATLVRLLLIATTEIANGEAYYYVWSRFPALSYYDHPPLIAWLTWLTTQFSHSSFAIRFGPVVYSALFGTLVYRLARRLFSPRAGFIAVAIVTAMPVFLVSNFVLNPESPLAPLWVLGLLLLEGMREHDEPWRPLAAGLVIGLAFLAKYSGVVLAAVGLLYIAVSPQARRWLQAPVPLRGRSGCAFGRPARGGLELPAAVALPRAALRRAHRPHRPLHLGGQRLPRRPGPVWPIPPADVPRACSW